MKLDLRQVADRIDDLNLRERAIIFVAAVLTVVILFNKLFLDPLGGRQKALSQQIQRTEAETKAIQAQIRVLAEPGAADPDAANRARVAQLRQQLSEVEAFLAGKQEELVPPDKIAGLLEQMLSRNRQLQLVGLKTLPASPIAPAKPEAPSVKGAISARTPGAQPERQLYRHGVQITVRGTYLELLHYLAELEKLPWRMYWGQASMSVEAYPSTTLTLTVYTLSMDRAWLVI